MGIGVVWRTAFFSVASAVLVRVLGRSLVVTTVGGAVVGAKFMLTVARMEAVGDGVTVGVPYGLSRVARLRVGDGVVVVSVLCILSGLGGGTMCERWFRENFRFYWWLLGVSFFAVRLRGSCRR